MTTPQYQKIPGEKLTVDQFTEVQQSLLPKFGLKMPRWTEGKTFLFRMDGSFLGVFQ
jgi:hypothetical protein